MRCSIDLVFQTKKNILLYLYTGANLFSRLHEDESNAVFIQQPCKKSSLHEEDNGIFIRSS